MSEKELNITLFDNNIQIEYSNSKDVIHINLNKPLADMTLSEIEVACGEHLDDTKIKQVLYNELVERFVVYDTNAFAILHDGTLMVNTERTYNLVTWVPLLPAIGCRLLEKNEGIFKVREAISKWSTQPIDNKRVEQILDYMKSHYIKFKTEVNINRGICKLRGLDCNGKWIENSVGAMNVVTFNNSAIKHEINYQVSDWCNEATQYLKGLTGYFRNGAVTVQLQLIDMDDKILDVITYERQITSAFEIAERIHKIISNVQKHSKSKSMDVF